MVMPRVEATNYAIVLVCEMSVSQTKAQTLFFYPFIGLGLSVLLMVKVIANNWKFFLFCPGSTCASCALVIFSFEYDLEYTFSFHSLANSH